MPELFDNLLPHLKTVRSDTRPDNSLQIRSVSTIPAMHEINNLAAKVLNGTPPSVMNSSNCLVYMIIKQYRNTISSPYRNSHARNIGDQRIHTLQFLTCSKRIRYFPNHTPMHLMRLNHTKRQFLPPFRAERDDIIRNVVIHICKLTYNLPIYANRN